MYVVLEIKEPNEPVEVAEPEMLPEVVRDDKLAAEPDTMTFFQDGMFAPIAVGYSSSPLPIVAKRQANTKIIDLIVFYKCFVT